MGEPKVVLVTGAGSGLGRAVGFAASAAGHRVVAAGRTAARLAETVSAAPGPGPVEAVVADVTDAESVRALFEHIERRWSRLDVLFNNAGVFGPVLPVEQVRDEQWRQVIDTNLTGSFLCAQAAFALMRRQDPGGGRIINNGSISAHVPRPYAVAYTASKHAVTGLTKALALEGRAHDIAVGQIDIGNAATELTAGIAAGALQADGSVRPEPTIDAAEVARLIVQTIDLPLNTSVPFLTVMATAMPYLGRG
ncbi:SDR family oxidoreductase [Nocardia macrotermitis]|uniref:3-phenylpropionate-dihydrodiol/cinnamic acid-dihydrodiol dehydrogenase n=1 Tax=Nocardia macrotermitis TaxID=2585198 RepID=A0A7K0D8U7_9NOCA|nr:SDR family oxidoreductase [Nocardia macrotermitis]MQY22205.1 3-phenylpropionate-dihydrodiol/cinnamic acid-dihydrodiol dehydrogenase [Nocardia macrotermitis]